MFGVLVVVLCPDPVADLGLGTGERQIPLIVFFARLIYSNSPRTFLVLAQTGDCQLEKKLRSTVAKPKRAPRRGYQGRSLSTHSTAEERGVHLRQVSSPHAGNFG
jgi:hypothetical protein